MRLQHLDANGIEFGILSRELATFDLPKLAKACRLERDNLFQFQGLQILATTKGDLPRWRTALRTASWAVRHTSATASSDTPLTSSTRTWTSSPAAEAGTTSSSREPWARARAGRARRPG